VQTWCGINLKSNRFGLFLDGVSIFEFLAQDHADATEVLTNLYNAQKNSFNNLYDSKVLTSCQNLFPTIFGRSSSDWTHQGLSQDYLPPTSGTIMV
jgi:hypothetical protein